MVNVVLDDKLRNNYRYYSNCRRNTKWWWIIWWWVFQVQLTNYCAYYLNFNGMMENKISVTH